PAGPGACEQREHHPDKGPFSAVRHPQPERGGAYARTPHRRVVLATLGRTRAPARPRRSGAAAAATAAGSSPGARETRAARAEDTIESNWEAHHDEIRVRRSRSDVRTSG